MLSLNFYTEKEEEEDEKEGGWSRLLVWLLTNYWWREVGADPSLTVPVSAAGVFTTLSLSLSLSPPLSLSTLSARPL